MRAKKPSFAPPVVDARDSGRLLGAVLGAREAREAGFLAVVAEAAFGCGGRVVVDGLRVTFWVASSPCFADEAAVGAVRREGRPTGFVGDLGLGFLKPPGEVVCAFVESLVSLSLAAEAALVALGSLEVETTLDDLAVEDFESTTGALPLATALVVDEDGNSDDRAVLAAGAEILAWSFAPVLLDDSLGATDNLVDVAVSLELATLDVPLAGAGGFADDAGMVGLGVVGVLGSLARPGDLGNGLFDEAAFVAAPRLPARGCTRWLQAGLAPLRPPDPAGAQHSGHGWFRHRSGFAPGPIRRTPFWSGC